jgi:hypothetical protein
MSSFDTFTTDPLWCSPFLSQQNRRDYVGLDSSLLGGSSFLNIGNTSSLTRLPVNNMQSQIERSLLGGLTRDEYMAPFERQLASTGLSVPQQAGDVFGPQSSVNQPLSSLGAGLPISSVDHGLSLSPDFSTQVRVPQHSSNLEDMSSFGYFLDSPIFHKEDSILPLRADFTMRMKLDLGNSGDLKLKPNLYAIVADPTSGLKPGPVSIDLDSIKLPLRLDLDGSLSLEYSKGAKDLTFILIQHSDGRRTLGFRSAGYEVTTSLDTVRVSTVFDKALLVQGEIGYIPLNTEVPRAAQERHWVAKLGMRIFGL